MSVIESVKPILTVVDDDGDLVISSTGPRGKEMAQAVLVLANGARKAVIISDGEMKVMKRNPAAEAAPASSTRRSSSPLPPDPSPAPDVQDEFVADLEAGKTGEVATGEAPAPPKPAKRVPRIYQDAAAPPAPELAEAEMDRLLQEAAQAEQEAAKVAEDRRFQAQQAVQAGEDPAEVAAAEPAAAKPRRRERAPALTAGRPCGRCGGGGQVMGESGFTGACPVCHGDGHVKSYGLKVR